MIRRYKFCSSYDDNWSFIFCFHVICIKCYVIMYLIEISICLDLDKVDVGETLPTKKKKKRVKDWHRNVNFSDLTTTNSNTMQHHVLSSSDSQAVSHLSLDLFHNKIVQYQQMYHPFKLLPHRCIDLSPQSSTSAQTDNHLDAQHLLNQQNHNRINAMKKKTKIYCCTLCSFACTWAYDLQRHQRNKHSPDKKKN